MNEIINKLPVKFRNDIEKATIILKNYGCSEIYIFGSLANEKYNEKSDIDIAIRGLKEELFFRVFAELRKELESEIDLIDLDDKSNRFSQFILTKGELIQVA